MRPLPALIKLLAGIAWLAGGVFALLAALLLSAWLWTAQADSLPRTLGWLQGWLSGPKGEQPLQVRDASGSLREGGRIGHLRWQRDGLEVELEGLELRWPASLWPDLLLRRELRLDALELDRLRLRDDSPASAERTPPSDLLLPWLQSVRLPLQASSIVIEGEPAIALGPLQADYRYEAGADGGLRHALQVHQLRWAEGDYRLQASLQATAPMRLTAQLQGELQAQAPGGSRQALTAQASVDGTLGGPAATLTLEADAQPAASSRSATTLRARALISPWAELPLASAELELHDIDLAVFWPQAPRTRLEGRWQADSAPADGAAWQLQGELRNRAPGPWQRGALPLQTLRAQLRFASGAWQLQALDASLIEGGRLQATGSLADGQLRLERAELSLGQARASAAGGLGLQERRLHGQLELELPGASASLRSEDSGGETRLALADARRLQRWIRHDLARWLPASALDALQIGALLDGQARLHASWNGPLQLDRLPSAWQAGLELPSLQIQSPAAGSDAPVQLRDWHLALQGRGGQAAIRLDGAASAGGWQAGTQLSAQLTLDDTPFVTGAELLLQTAELQASDPQRRLSARLSGGTRLRWHGGSELSLSAGQASLSLASSAGQPAAAPIELAWEASSWSAGRLVSRGRASGLALAWVDQLLADQASGNGVLAQQGIAGDIALQAGWELDLPLQPPARGAAPARSRLEIARDSGDLSLLLSDAAGGSKPQAIGLEQASASLTLDGTRLRTRLRWDSRLAGQLDAELDSELAPPTPGRPDWSWPAEAPLSGRVRAALPRLDLWSRLAPPGWRISGRLQADASLGGSRRQPEWRGTVQASDLALRSLLDGLDFSGGELHATLLGEQLRLDSLRLRGAGGESGGLLLGSGSLRWPQGQAAADQPRTTLQPELALELEARQLRLLARASTAPTTTRLWTFWPCARTRPARGRGGDRRGPGPACASTPTPNCPTAKNWPGCCSAARQRRGGPVGAVAAGRAGPAERPWRRSRRHRAAHPGLDEFTSRAKPPTPTAAPAPHRSRWASACRAGST
jgi:translocation and assembly module TamB